MERERNEYEAYEPETENRMKNLMWTVSGDYGLDTKLDLASFRESRYVAMFDAVKQGAFARFFDQNAFALYLLKKIYYGAEEGPLTELAQMAVETASYPKILPERPGVREIRDKAYEYLLEHRFGKLSRTATGKIKLVLMQGTLYGRWDCQAAIRRPLEALRTLEGAETAMDLIRVVDALYNSVIDPRFEEKHGGLEHVLAATPEEMREFPWKEFLEEEADGEWMEQYLNQIENRVVASDMPEAEDEPEREKTRRRRIVVLDQEALGKVYHYIEKTYGRSYLNEQEQKRVNGRLCRGAHCDCSLYYTDGILENPVMRNAQYVNAKKQAQNNYRLFLNSRNVVRRNVETMTDYLKRSLRLRTETDVVYGDYGTVIPGRLWRVGRTDPERLFSRTIRQNGNEFAVCILMDASGSQRDRQGQVALQGYMISEALSNAGLPHQIMSFCTFWDYTVMQRFRDYDAPREENERVLNFTTSSNNRDGLAIRAAGDGLLQRPEEHKILIVLSDGRPNDVVVNRPGSRNPKPYFGEYAIADTAFEVRKLRGDGICVLGVFSGQEKDLQAEMRIFGRDFAYIRDIRNFSKVVSKYLQRILEQDIGG